MTNEQIFSLASLAALAGWLILAASPLRPGLIIAIARWVGVALAVTYAVVLALHWGQGEGGFGSLAEVKALFSTDGVLLAGWVHYLAFDLWIGAWEVEDAPRHGLSHWLVLPCLFLTFMFGPVGLLLYLALRTGAARLRARRA